MKERRKKAIVCILILIGIVFNNMGDIYASEEAYKFYTTEEGVEQDIPNEVKTYFESNYESAILLSKACGKIDESVESDELNVGNPFVIYELDGSPNDIWYYPIYMDAEIKCLIVISAFDDELSLSVTGEFVNQLNELGYDNNMLFIKENDNIYAVDEEGNSYFLSGDSETVEETNRDYNELKEYIENNCCNVSISQSVQNIESEDTGITVQGGATQTITNGKECIMTNCLVAQYEYGICWAASVATIVRYMTNLYPYSTLNAIDVARAVGEYYGVDTNDSTQIDEWLGGGDVDDAQLALALYGVYYTVMNRVLSYSEIKSEIDNSSPIYIAAEYYNEKGDRSGHATVIYGYYHILKNNYFIMWNPGEAETQSGFYTDEKAYYIYNDHQYVWYNTVCNGLYVFK